MEIVPNLHPSPFGLNVRTKSPRSSICVRTLSQFTNRSRVQDAGQWRWLRHPIQSRQVGRDADHPDWQYRLNKVSGLRRGANPDPTQAAQDGLAVETGALIADTKREGFP